MAGTRRNRGQNRRKGMNGTARDETEQGPRAARQQDGATERFAVALIDQTDAGWLVDAASAGEAVDQVHRTQTESRWRSELLVWTESWYREHRLKGGPFPQGWRVLAG